MKEKYFCNHLLYPELLNEHSIVFDCGAYKGLFTKEIFKYCNPQIYAYEPNKLLFNALTQRFSEHGSIHISNKAISSSIGNRNLYITSNIEGSSLYNSKDNQSNLSYPIRTTTIQNEMEKNNLNKIDVLKLNVEGMELNILNNIPPSILENVSQITVSFHLNKGIRGYTKEKMKKTIRYMKLNKFNCIPYYFGKNMLFIKTEILNGY